MYKKFTKTIFWKVDKENKILWNHQRDIPGSLMEKFNMTKMEILP